MILRFVAAVAMVLMVSFNLHAQESATEDEGWSGKAALGYLATSGNSESASLNTHAELGYSAGRWKHLLDASAISASESDQSTAEAYAVGFKSEFSVTENDYVFGRLVWRKDLFSGYDQQFSQTAGYGRRLIDTTAHQLSAEIGAGARQSELRDGTMENDVIARGGVKYSWLISETATFNQDLAVEWGSVNVYTESVSALKATIFEDLALVASYTIKNNSDVPAGTDKTDTYTALSLEYAF